MRRRGFVTLVLVLLFGALLLVWGGSQHFTTHAIAKRLRIAEADRRVLLVAESSIEQSIASLKARAEWGGGSEEGGGALAEFFGSLEPGGISAQDLAGPKLGSEHDPFQPRVLAVRVQAYPRTGRGMGTPPEATEPPRPVSSPVDCEQFRKHLEEWSGRPYDDPDRRAARHELYGDWRPPASHGILEMIAIAKVDVSGVRVYKRLESLWQYSLEAPACPEVRAEVTGSEAGSDLSIHPVELARVIQTWRSTHDQLTAEELEEVKGYGRLSRLDPGESRSRASLLPDEVPGLELLKPVHPGGAP